MRVILLCDVPKLGKKGEIKEVADGYGRNYLIARGMAVMESGASKKILDRQNKEAEELDALRRKQAEKLAEELEQQHLEFKVKARDGKVSGSISSKQIEDELKKQGIVIDKRNIKDSAPLNELGTYEVEIKLYKDITGKIKVSLTEE